MQFYRASLFIFPKKVVRQVVYILKAYLWNGLTKGTARVNVAREDVTFPKTEGGLELGLFKISLNASNF